MTTLLSSEAVFDEKAAECGLSAAVLAEIKRQNIRNLGTWAFFSAGQPGQVASDDRLIQEWVVKVNPIATISTPFLHHSLSWDNGGVTQPLT